MEKNVRKIWKCSSSPSFYVFQRTIVRCWARLWFPSKQQSQLKKWLHYLTNQWCAIWKMIPPLVVLSIFFLGPSCVGKTLLAFCHFKKATRWYQTATECCTSISRTQAEKPWASTMA